MVRRCFSARMGMALAWVLAITACESRVSVGNRCTSDSECGELRCEFGRCRAECVRASDCGDPAALCIGRIGRGVCTLPAVDRCSADCSAVGLVCDGELCTTPCMDACLEGATCDVAENVCVAVSVAPDAGGAPLDGGTADAGASSSVVDFCIGTYHACVVDSPGGTVRCWGVGHGGELGHGEALAAGGSNTVDCTVQNDGSTCTATFAPRTVVDRSGPIRDVVQLVCGDRTTIARTGDGQLYSWGLGSNGELGRDFVPPVLHSYEAEAGLVTDRVDVPLTGVLGAALGTRHGCAWSASGARCWGAQYATAVGQLGNGADVEFDHGGLAAAELGSIHGVAMADLSTCALGADGVRCVGLNEVGAIGETTSLEAIVRRPANLVQLDGVSLPAGAIVAGPQFYCALFGGRPACWGQAVEGSLGRGDVSGYASRCPDGVSLCDPRGEPVSGALVFDAIASGPAATTVCGTSGGRVYCWGSSERGEAGSVTRVLAPRDPVLDAAGAPLDGVRAVRVGGHTACALTNDDRLFCWGSNQWGHFRSALDTPPSVSLVQHVRAQPVPLD